MPEPTPDAGKGLAPEKVVTITFDPVRGVGVGWTNMSGYEVLAGLALAQKAVLGIIAPDPVTPLTNVPGGTGGVQSRFTGRRVDRG